MKEEQCYWGKYHSPLKDGYKPRKIWIGPMTQSEMKEHFEEFRHNCRYIK